ncbi:hypothetical protein, partial [Phocaeicola plebeius]|uniref:hypothetical protein n=1 Tax=Phocaeicola plebeius TaxID=310297 RepID=UPI0026EA811C
GPTHWVCSQWESVSENSFFRYYFYSVGKDTNKIRYIENCSRRTASTGLKLINDTLFQTAEILAKLSIPSKKCQRVKRNRTTFITFAHIVSNIVQFENGNTRQFYTTC